MKKINWNGDIGLLIWRVSLGGMMLMHGISKLIGGLGWLKGMLLGMGLPSFIAYGVLVGEVLAPILLMLGWKTRIAAAVMAFNMVIAVAMVHGDGIFAIGKTGGWSIELPALYFFGALLFVFTGAGKYALDRTNPV